MVYAFDMLSQNPDRRGTNPNCARKDGASYTRTVTFLRSDSRSETLSPRAASKKLLDWRRARD
jgi:hypothetical protein